MTLDGGAGHRAAVGGHAEGGDGGGVLQNRNREGRAAAGDAGLADGVAILAQLRDVAADPGEGFFVGFQRFEDRAAFLLGTERQIDPADGGIEKAVAVA